MAAKKAIERTEGFASFEAALKSAREAEKTEIAAKPKKERKSKSKAKVHLCGCGCGTAVAGSFAPGHDGRVLGWFCRLVAGKEVPEVAKNKGLQEAFVCWLQGGKPHSLKRIVSVANAE